MPDTQQLYGIAEAQEIPVLRFPLKENGSMCIQTAAGRCYIGLDDGLLGSTAELRVHLAHELGHCIRGAFYNEHAACDLRRKHEDTADRWAIAALVPRRQFDRALRAGYTELWSLAEVFNVTLDFMKKAACYYRNGNLAADSYF